MGTSSRNDSEGARAPDGRLAPWAWIELPDDLGVMNVGGRIGASRGPEAVSRVFSRIGGSVDVKAALVRKLTAQGLGSDIHRNLELAAALVAEGQRAASATVVVGGGHDHGYSQLKGIRDVLPAGARLGCIYLDAHLDVRPPAPEISSGSPFYLALEERLVAPEHLVPFGIQPQSNSAALFTYVRDKGIDPILFSEVRTHKRALKRFQAELERLEDACDAIVLSLDLDCLSQAAAPGVSAPQAEGFDGRDVLAMVEVAARSSKVVSLGIFELNPVFDRDDATARIAATAAWRFIANRVG